MPYANPEDERAYRKAYWEKNKERIKAYHRERYYRDVEKTRAVKRDRENARKAKNPEGFAADKRAYYHKNKDAILESMRWQRLLKKYGVTQEEYDAMFAFQGGLCAICNRPETVKHHGKLTMLAVDHDHETGLVRGLLCRGCNTSLGHFQESMDVLASAISYLRSGGPALVAINQKEREAA